MKLLKTVDKTKVKKFYSVESIKELSSLNLSELIPEEAKLTEILYIESKGLLKIDYITNLKVTE